MLSVVPLAGKNCQPHFAPPHESGSSARRAVTRPTAQAAGDGEGEGRQVRDNSNRLQKG